MSERDNVTAYSMIENINEVKNRLFKAIDCYKKALEACDIKERPESYALIKNNLGLAYVKLASITDAKNNLRKAIKAYHEALKILIIYFSVFLASKGKRRKDKII